MSVRAAEHLRKRSPHGARRVLDAQVGCDRRCDVRGGDVSGDSLELEAGMIDPRSGYGIPAGTRAGSTTKLSNWCPRPESNRHDR